MNVSVVRPNELTPEQICAWSDMMSSEDLTDSPFFHPAFTEILARFRKQVCVAVITQNEHPVAFFPFEKHGKTALPLGVKLSDFQGIIRAPGITVNVRQLLADCGLTSWRFNHAVTTHSEMKRWLLRIEDSPFIDTSGGFEAYVQKCKAGGGKTIMKTRRKWRKLEREVGPLRFEWDSSDRCAFDTLLAWKSAQRQQTGTHDLLQYDWAVQALDAIRSTHLEDFGGVLSTLHAGNTLAAVFLNMRSRTVLHEWFIAYNIDFYDYSPGSLLKLAYIEAAAERGIKRVDLGRGAVGYKQSWSTGSLPVGEGAADLNPLRHLNRCVQYRVFSTLRNTKLYEALQGPKRIIRNLKDKQAGTFSE